MAGETVNLSPDATNINITSMVGSTEQYPALVEAIKSAIDKSEKKKESKEDKNPTYRLLQKSYLLSKGDYDLSEQNLKNTQAYFDKAIKQGKGLAASMAKYANGIGIIMETVKQMAVPMISETKKRMNWLSELEKSGVHLAEGFDESFTQLANDAKMSHDQFARMLIANSRQVAKLNAIGLNGARTFSNSLNKSVGKFGYTTDEAATALSAYMENALGFYSKETLAEKLKNDATTKYLKNLKELSAATGKSVDILAQENQLKEDTLFAKKLNAEHPELYGTLKQAGLNDSQIKALVSGRPNEESVMFNATPEGRAIWSQFERVTRSSLAGRLSNEDLIRRVGNILKGPDAERGRKRLENMDYSTASVLSESQGHNKILGAVPGLSRFDDFAAQQVGNNKGDTNIVNSFTEYQAQKDRLANNWNKALGMSAYWASNWLDIFSGGLSWANTALSSFAGTTIAYSILFGKTKAGLWSFSKVLKGITGGFHALGDKRYKGTVIEKFLKGMFGSKNKTLVNIIAHPLKSLKNVLTSGSLSIAKSFAIVSLKILGAGAAIAAAGYSVYKVGEWLGGWASKVTGGGAKGALLGGAAGAVGGATIAGIAGAIIGSVIFPGVGTAAGWALGMALGGAILGGAVGAYKGYGPATTVNYKNEYSYVQEQDVQKSKVQNETLSELKTMNLYMQNTASNTSQLSYSSSESLKEQKFNTLNSNNSAQFAYG